MNHVISTLALGGLLSMSSRRAWKPHIDKIEQNTRRLMGDDWRVTNGQQSSRMIR